MKRLEYKQPADQFVYVVDFNNVLGSGDWITWATATPSLFKGRSHSPIFPLPDVEDAAQVVLNALASDGAARILVGNGTHEQTYKIKVLASAQSGNVFEEDLILPVADF